MAGLPFKHISKRRFGGVLVFCTLFFLWTHNISYPIILSVSKKEGGNITVTEAIGQAQYDALPSTDVTDADFLSDSEATMSAQLPPLSDSHDDDVVAFHKPVVPVLNKAATPQNTEWSPRMDVLSIKDAYRYPIKFATLQREGSTVKLITPKTFYRVGEDIRVKINVLFKPSNGYNYGGDNIRIHMVELRKGASVNGYVIDHHNGSYTGVLKAMWAGECTIITILKYTRYQIAYLYDVRQKLSTVRTLSGKFIKGRSVVIAPCRPQATVLDGSKGICNLTKLNAGQPWFCQSPKQPSLNCDDLQFIIRDDYNENDILSRTKPNSGIWNAESSLLGKKIIINVKGLDKKTDVEKPSCNTYNLSALWEQPSPTGHFFQRRWYPYHCKTHSGPYTYCAKNKHFIFYGDSTSRQWGEHLSERFNCNEKVINIKNHQIFYKNNDLKLTLQYAKHNYPGNCMDSHNTDDSFPNLASEKLEDLVRDVDKDTMPVIIVHIYFHYTYYQPTVYRNRIRMLRKSLEFILRMRPDAKILIKGPHLIVKKTLGTCDYFAYVYRLILVEELAPLRDKLIYLDNIDISNAGHVVDIHPDYNIVREMVSHMLAYVCD